MIESPVLVIGGTRGTGLLIARLLDQRQIDVRLLARDPARAAVTLGAEFDIVRGDITKPETLQSAMNGARHIVFTAGRRSGRPFRERQIRETEYQGVLNTLNAARDAGFTGRFLYMTASGVAKQSFWSFALNLYKGNTLVWRRKAEEAIRASGLAYTVIRAGMLSNQAGGTHAIEVTQSPLPLSPRYRIARADVAEVFVAALEQPRTACTTFEVIWGEGPRQNDWAKQLEALAADQP
jgi:uncharacterized protein YbjT (DUF2867 family)